LTEDLIFHTNDETLAAFVAFYREKKVERSVNISSLTLEERLASYVVEGTKENLIPDLQEALTKYSALEVINGPLMKGMEEVGRLFNNNELIVAEVLQSAEVMKASVNFLEQFMEKSESSLKGKIILATVKGDVHDIGKNLVEIILSNNGYQIVNLGIKVPPEQLIEAYRREKPDAIGLSGLLVKSAQQMVVTAQDFKNAGIDVPLFVGGAALTRKFTSNRIAPEYDGLVIYAKDAMDGLDLANRVGNPVERQKLIEELRVARESDVREVARPKAAPAAPAPTRSPIISADAPVFMPPNMERHILRDYPVPHLAPYINYQMLMGKHLGLSGGTVERLIQQGNPKALQLRETVDGILAEAQRDKIIHAQGMYRFFPAQSDGNDVLVYDPHNPAEVLERFSFPRQDVDPYLCLADFLKSVDSGVMDYVGFLVVTAGLGVRELSEKWKEQGDYLRSHTLQATALELAESFAERIHHMMRDSWGFPDPAEMTMKERHAARYQGIRVSFGYPACPNLDDQELLFRLMKPEDIDVQLTEGCMMEPEASVSAMVFAHPQARYFNVEKN
jgi:5-methyltetrahydrofolate--homocysteine methyltransferase